MGCKMTIHCLPPTRLFLLRVTQNRSLRTYRAGKMQGMSVHSCAAMAMRCAIIGVDLVHCW